MRHYFPFLFLIIAAGCNNMVFAQPTGSGNTVIVTNERVKDSFELVAHNKNPWSVTLSLKITGVNFRADRSLPLTTVLIAGERRRVLTIRVDDKTKPFGFNNRYTWFAGDIHAIHNNSFTYRLPFEKGATFTVGQGYNGSFSHQGDSKYAVDFIMPEGTNVMAARGGVVIQIRDDSNRGGNSYSYKSDSNFIVIEHSDGTLGEYAHLKKGGVLVEPGDLVSQGQVIGLSGNTGFSSGPHLHFMVTRVMSDGYSRSLPVKFRTARGVVEDFRKGESYTAM